MEVYNADSVQVSIDGQPVNTDGQDEVNWTQERAEGLAAALMEDVAPKLPDYAIPKTRDDAPPLSYRGTTEGRVIPNHGQNGRESMELLTNCVVPNLPIVRVEPNGVVVLMPVRRKEDGGFIGPFCELDHVNPGDDTIDWDKTKDGGPYVREVVTGEWYLLRVCMTLEAWERETYFDEWVQIPPAILNGTHFYERGGYITSLTHAEYLEWLRKHRQ